MATKKEMIEAIKPLHEKYSYLVWYARQNREEVKLMEDKLLKDSLESKMQMIETNYTNEVFDLIDPVDGDWEHGFNSGALAIIRLLLDKKINMENFPNLEI